MGIRQEFQGNKKQTRPGAKVGMLGIYLWGAQTFFCEPGSWEKLKQALPESRV